MALKLPDSMDDLVYWTNRAIGEGKATVWVYRKDCPKCKKAKMGKPENDTGGVKIRATEYICPACKYSVEKTEYEESLDACAIYTCPTCKYEGECTVPFKRKSVKGVHMLRLQCTKCKGNIDVTKKMK